MTVWLISPYGPVPGEGWRDYRFAIMCKTLANSGHNTIWWTPNFSHHFKRYRSEGWLDRDVQPGFTLRLVPTSAYSRNIGFGRLRYEAAFVRHAFRRAVDEARPDCIIATEPPQIVGRLGAKLAKHFACPLILDVMDQWPELFSLAFPRLLRPLSEPLLAPLYWLRKRNYRRADGLLSLCETYRTAALLDERQLSTVPSATIFNGIDVEAFRSLMQDGQQVLSRLPEKKQNDVWAIYAGTLGNNYDIPTLLKAAEACRSEAPNLRFLVAGNGPLLPLVKSYTARYNDSNVSYLGHLTPAQLAGVYRLADIGLCIYAKGSNVAMPDKAYDYMAAGLPIINSLPGELASLLSKNGGGTQYCAGDSGSLTRQLVALTIDTATRKAMAAASFGAAMTFDSAAQYSVLPDFVSRVCSTKTDQPFAAFQEANVI